MKIGCVQVLVRATFFKISKGAAIAKQFRIAFEEFLHGFVKEYLQKELKDLPQGFVQELLEIFFQGFLEKPWRIWFQTNMCRN